MIYSYSREFEGTLTEEETRKLVMDKTKISKSTYYRRLTELQNQKRQRQWPATHRVLTDQGYLNHHISLHSAL